MIPKSLHTITALAKLGAYLITSDVRHADGAPLAPMGAAVRAAQILGYEGTSAEDSYGLIAKAAAVIAKGAR